MTKLVVITGGIGSGKSTFSKEVKKRGLKLLDSDEQVSQIYKKPNKNFLNYLRKIDLGPSIKNGKIDKKYISKKIFFNKKIKTDLEKYIFKLVRKNRKEFIKKEKKIKTNIVFFDIPLLFENDLNKKFDLIISIVSSQKERYKRLKKTKNLSKELFNKIIKSQTTNVERIKNSDIIIYNNKGIKDYIKRINLTLDKIT